MPEIKNTFLKSKMNKDLEARIMPNGEYRDAQNASVSASEDASVGSLENIRGNKLLTNFGLTDFNLEIIGQYSDLANNRIFFFLTNYTDASTDSLSNLAIGNKTANEPGYVFNRNGGANYICYCQLPNVSSSSEISISNINFSVLLTGTFLNFSKTNPICGVNMIENLLFWTDNRNQPRKINVDNAIANPLVYYTNEDHISVAKYAPYKSISFIKTVNGVVKSTLKNEVDEWLAPFFGAPGQILQGSVGTADTLVFDEETSGTNLAYTNVANHLGGNIPTKPIRVKSADDSENIFAYVQNIDVSTVPAKVFLKKNISGNPVTVLDIETELGWSNGTFLFEIQNPDYNSAFKGDKKLLEDKFVRFSYRFKYDDNEYSLTAPFTQHAFIPKQYGYFIQGDDERTKESSIVSFMENQVTTAGLVIDLPYKSSELADKLKVSEIQLLYKASDDLNVKVIADVKVSNLTGSPSTMTLKSAGSGFAPAPGTVTNKATTGGSGSGLTLDLIVNAAGETTSATVNKSGEGYRVGDVIEVPVQGGGTAAEYTVASLNSTYIYNYSSEKPIKVLTDKEVTRVSDIVPMRAQTQEVVGNRIVYGNFLQNNETPLSLEYSLGTVKKGDTTLNTNKEFLNNTLKQGRSYQVGIVLQDRYGRASNVIINDNSSSLILNSTIFNGYTGGGTDTLSWPGDSLQISFAEKIPDLKTSTYNGTWVEGTNPLGWYTYKIVVKQQEQDYYNIYVPGALSGNIIYTKNDAVTASNVKGLLYSQTGEIASIALFNDNINKIPRDLKEVGPTDEIYGSSVVLYNRVKQTHADVKDGATPPAVTIPTISEQNLTVSKQEVTTIRPFSELGEWTTKKNLDLYYVNMNPDPSAGGASQYAVGTFIYPGAQGEVDPFFLKNNKNPLIATIEVGDRMGFTATSQQDPNWDFAQKLMVFETEPFKSNIDIYYETSSAGTISELNSSINSQGDYNTKAPNSLSPVVSTGWLESTSVSQPVTNVFQILNSGGTPVQDSTTSIVIDNVTNGNGDPVSNSPFVIDRVQTPIAPSTPATFRLISSSFGRIPYLSNSQVHNTYNVTFRLSVDGQPDKQVTEQIDLSNVAPSLNRVSVSQFVFNPVLSNPNSELVNASTPSFLASTSTTSISALDVNNPQPYDSAVPYSGVYKSFFTQNQNVNDYSNSSFYQYKYPICTLSHSTNGFEVVTTPYNASNDSKTLTYANTKRLEGMTFSIDSVARYDAYLDYVFFNSESNAKYYYQDNDSYVSKKQNFVLDVNTVNAQVELNFTIPGGGRVSNGDLPSNRPGQNQWKGAWLYAVNLIANDASGTSGSITSNTYTVHFIITR